MPKEYSQEQIWKVYKSLPQELKEAVFAEETAENIWEICERNGIEDDRISEIARYTGRVLMGLIPPDKFQEALEKELKLEKDVAKKISQEINRFIFYPVKISLEELYKIEIAAPAGFIPKRATTSREGRRNATEKTDQYREPIE